MNFVVPDGSGGPVTVEAGALGCGDGNVHQPENLEGPAEFVMVEFKDRRRFAADVGAAFRRPSSGPGGLPVHDDGQRFVARRLGVYDGQDPPPVA